jgi:serine/threonine-protein kinase
VKRLVDQALEKSPSERARFLGEACAGDESLRGEVESLLGYEQESLLERGPPGSIEPTREVPSGRSASPRAVDLPYGRFSPGAILASRYRIIERVGQGGMGDVYRADDLTLDQSVALKFLPEELSQNPGALGRFRGEVRLARQISHPNLCRVYDIGEADGLHFLSMEYIRGEDLRSLLRRIGRLPADKAVEVAAQIASGLAAAHDRGVLHRDLKPANVMIDERGQARITDFGLAAAAGTVESRDIRSGTPGYMAPEQWAGEEVTERSDIYSLGLVLYELFTGSRARSDPTVDEITPPSGIVSDMDPRVERVILQCLSKDPAARPPSANAVRLALPGRDQLAAAVARGETPAPALVAEAGEYDGLSPAIAWACLGGILLGLAALLATAGQTRLTEIVPLPKSTDVLVADAREILRTLDYPTPERDFTFGFRRDTRYIDELMKEERSPDWWALLARGEPNIVRFWYRESPRFLVPHRITEFFPEEHDPPLSLPGMVTLELDTGGRLRQLVAMPPERDDSTDEPGNQDWSALLAAAGFDPSSLHPDEPRWLPPTHADNRAAWEGVYPGAPEIPIRIEAAAYRGRPVAFRIVEPWSEPAGLSSEGWTHASDVVPSASGRIAHIALHFLLIFTLAGFAHRNLKLGRCDRKRAFRLATALFVLMMIHWLLAAHHVPDGSQLQIFFGGLYRSSFVFGLGGLLYLALEPYARKLWPRSLASWVRLLDGRWRDPIVGRDVLVGAVMGPAIALAVTARRLVPQWISSVPPRPDFPQHPAELLALRGVRESVAELLAIQINIATHVLFLFIALLLLRVLFRRTWIAVVVHWLLYVFVYGSGFGYVPIALIITAWYVVFFRFGWVSIFVATLLADALGGFPLTADPSAWHAHASFLLVGFCLSLALYGFKTSLGKRPVFQDLLGEG